MAASSYVPPVSSLLTLGECQRRRAWPDYPALGLGVEHIPELIRMALDDDLHMSASDSHEVWAPVHAWRALAQVGAEEAIKPLTRLLVRIDDAEDDWVSQELPEVFAMIGPAAILALADYLADPSSKLWARVAAAHSLQEIGAQHPPVRDDCVAILAHRLETFAHLDPVLNAYLISLLVDLKAVEAAPLMGQAFGADRVDISIPGDWEDVQIELGLLDQRRTPKPNYHQAFWEALGLAATPPPEEPREKRKRKRKRKG